MATARQTLLLSVLAALFAVDLAACADEHDAGPPAAGPPPSEDGGHGPDASADANAASDGGHTDAGPAPVILSTTPTEGARIYPRRVGEQSPETTSIEVLFSEPMDTSRSTVALATVFETRTLAAAWSEDGRTMTVTVPREPLSGAKPSYYRYGAGHRLDLRDLRSAAGALVDPSSGPTLDGVLDFQTLPEDFDLEHACGHANEALFATYGLAQDAMPRPLVDRGHKRYRLVFPQGTSEGEARIDHVLEASPPLSHATYRLYVDRNVRMTVTRLSDGAEMRSSVEPTPDACDGIRYMARAELYEGDAYHVFFLGDGVSTYFDAIVEW